MSRKSDAEDEDEDDADEGSSTRKLLYDSKVASEIKKWTREEMVDLFLDKCFESDDAKDFILDERAEDLPH